MYKSAFLAIAISAPLALGATLAHASEYCTSAPRSEWRSINDAKTAAEALGFRNVQRIKTDDSCYEAYAFDKNGRRVEIYIDPVSLKVLRVKNES